MHSSTQSLDGHQNYFINGVRFCWHEASSNLTFILRMVDLANW